MSRRPIRPELVEEREEQQAFRPVVVDPPRPVVVAEPDPEPEPVGAGLAVSDEALAELSGPGTAPDTQEWERALLTAVLQGYEDVGALARLVGPADYYEPAHGAIWQAILDLWNAGTRPTVMMVMDRMGGSAQRLPGGPHYLTELFTDHTPHVWEAQTYAEHVRECALKRQIGQLGARAQQVKADPDATSEQFLAGLTVWMDRVAASQQPHSAGLSSALERVIGVAERGQELALPTPWEDVDELLGGGLYPGQLIAVGARPGAGKSMLLENLATHVARRDDCDALFCSLEMTEDELVTRTLAWTAGVPLNRLRAGGSQVEEYHWQRIAAAEQTIRNTHLTIVDESDQTVRSIRMEARRAHMAAKRAGRRLGLVCVDYVGLITGMNPKHDVRQVISEASREMKKLAKELHCTVVLAAQLNRNGADRKDPRPILTDFKDSGSLEQDADVAILLWEVEEENELGQMAKTGDVELIVPKQRNGPTGRRVLQKWGHYQRFAQPGARSIAATR